MIKNIINSIDNSLAEEKEQKLRSKLGKEIYDSIFTSEVISKLNESDFSGLIDEDDEEDLAFLFSTIFPVFIEKDDVIFRLYKHKIEVDLSDEMKDRYIYIFSDGRLTSGLFECFRLYDNEYVYGIKRIIEVIPLFKNAICESLNNFEKNQDTHKQKILDFKKHISKAQDNYNEIIKLLKK